MKIRSSFVSNSSSASYIIDGRLMTVKQIARKMIPIREWSIRDKDVRKGTIISDEELINILDNSNLPDDEPLMFRSCNYDTYIIKIDDYIFIDTCNNHDFYSILHDLSVWPDAGKVMKLVKCYDISYDDERKYCEELYLSENFKFTPIESLKK